MAKARMVRSELRTSTVVAEWPIEARYFWILLWGYVDDYGRAKANTKLIKADCFPLDDDVTPELIGQWLLMFEKSKVVHLYTVEGIDYVAVKNWDEHQKVPHPGKDTCPAIPSDYKESTEIHETFMKVAEQSHETFTPKLSKDKLNKELLYSEAAPVKKYSEEFETFWTAYPRRQQKGDAWKAWEVLRKKRELPELTLLTDTAKKYAERVTDPQFQKLPAGWLRSACWDDEPLTASPTVGYVEREGYAPGVSYHPPAPEGKRYAVDVVVDDWN